MKNNYSVYIHTSPEGKVYVGCTGMDPETRWFGGKGYTANPAFVADIERFGWDNFKHEIIASGLTQEAAIKLEAEKIHEYRATDPTFGYNLRPGPGYYDEANPKYKEQMSQALSRSLKGRIMSAEHREKMRVAQSRNHQENDYLWVSRDREATIINSKLLDQYLGNGWVKGRLPGQYVYIHKGDITQRIPAIEADTYLKEGWEPGKSEKIAANIRKSRQQYIWMCDDQEFATAKDLADYLRSTRGWDIVPSTITAAFRGQKFAKYPDLLTLISRKENSV